MTAVEANASGQQVEASQPVAGYDTSRLNALRHGILARSPLLPWEEPQEYRDLLDALTAEHAPHGPTEDHLIEELAGVLWRKRRLRLAEAATYQRALQATTEKHRGTAQAALVLTSPGGAKVEVSAALRSTPDSAQRELAALDVDQGMTVAAMDHLQTGGGDAYPEAMAQLHKSTLEAWENQLTWTKGDYEGGATPYQADAANLRRYLETEILPWYKTQRAELRARPMVRAQALGEALDPDKLERLGRYEVHLDRKFERTLSTLLRLQDLRRTRLVPATGS